MASLISRMHDLISAVGTDYKQIRTWLTGTSTGDLTGLTTTAKSDIITAINEVNSKSAGGSAPATSETVAGVIRTATQSEATTGTLDFVAVSPLKMKTFTDAMYQPVDSDLTAIAALTTTAYGRSFLALANQSGLQALLGLDTDITLSANSDTKIATQHAVKAYADGLLDANNAYQYKGGLDASSNPNFPAASAGWTYKVTAAGHVGGASGVAVEVGDTVTCLVDNSVSGTQAAVGANWLIMQTNIDGAVVGPASSTTGAVVTFSGTTGKAIADSAVLISIDGTMAANSDAKLPTEKALRTYLASNYYTQAQLGDPDTDLVAIYTAAKA